MNTLTDPIILPHEKVALLPLEAQHLEQLHRLARHPRIWTHFAVDGSQVPVFLESLEAPQQYPFVIIDRSSNMIIGSTRYLDINLQHRKLEIGWTWLHPDHWGTGINNICKKLLLNHAFNQLHMLRVQFRTDENNLRSRKAIEKTGAQFEGILRNDLIRSNGSSRNSALYSLIALDKRLDQ